MDSLGGSIPNAATPAVVEDDVKPVEVTPAEPAEIVAAEPIVKQEVEVAPPKAVVEEELPAKAVGVEVPAIAAENIEKETPVVVEILKKLEKEEEIEEIQAEEVKREIAAGLTPQEAPPIDAFEFLSGKAGENNAVATSDARVVDVEDAGVPHSATEMGKQFESADKNIN